MQRVLVIAYGNPLRSDDGIAWQAAENLRKRLPESVAIVCAHQLMPELAEDASLADFVIFVDASRDGEPGEVKSKEIFPQQGTQNFSHHLAPADVMALTSELYGAWPRAFVISVNGECFDHGKTLSPTVTKALPQLEATLEELVHGYSRVSDS